MGYLTHTSALTHDLYAASSVANRQVERLHSQGGNGNILFHVEWWTLPTKSIKHDEQQQQLKNAVEMLMWSVCYWCGTKNKQISSNGVSSNHFIQSLTRAQAHTHIWNSQYEIWMREPQKKKDEYFVCYNILCFARKAFSNFCFYIHSSSLFTTVDFEHPIKWNENREIYMYIYREKSRKKNTIFIAKCIYK